MLTLSPYLATYIGIGLVLAWVVLIGGGARGYRNAFRAKVGRGPGWIACTFPVLVIAALWPLVFTAVAVMAVRR